jgi:hypothetical protein
VRPLHEVALHTHLPLCPPWHSGVAPVHWTQLWPQWAAVSHGSHVETLCHHDASHTKSHEVPLQVGWP